MIKRQRDIEFFEMLEESLPGSDGEQRKTWAVEIIERDIDLKVLSKLLNGHPRTAMRFLWLLSDVGLAAPDKLRRALPFLLELSRHAKYNFKNSFASYWHYVGVPAENEGEAIDLLFKWLNSPEANVTCKTRSLWVLLKLCDKYPDLKNELRLSLMNVKEKYSKEFKKRVEKVLLSLKVE